MPIHDWARVYAGIFHDFQAAWIYLLKRVLNDDALSPDYYALAEQTAIDGVPDTLALKTGKDRVVVRHTSDDRVVAIVEIVSPGNKSSRHAIQAFIGKAVDLLANGVHLLVIDPHRPTRRDPGGVHSLIQEELGGPAFDLPPDKPFTLAAYEAVRPPRAYVEPVAVGDVLPDMPLFLVPGGHVPVPLEKTYQAAWESVPARWRRVIEAG